MPLHDWPRVEAGIYHHFHHSWIEEIQRFLNAKLLPSDYYAMAEQHAAGFGPDVLTLQTSGGETPDLDESASKSDDGGVMVAAPIIAPPSVEPTAETEMEFYRRKQSHIAVRHVSGDRVVAVIEIVSPGNKSSRNAMRAFVEKAAELLDHRVHLLILDVFPPGARDPEGIHGEIWQEIAGEEYHPTDAKPLTFAAYESDLTVKAYVQHASVGEDLPTMPLFLEPNGQVPLPLNVTYQSAWSVFPSRWQRVVEGQDD